jgi:hypothetical protein
LILGSSPKTLIKTKRTITHGFLSPLPVFSRFFPKQEIPVLLLSRKVPPPL